MKQAIGQDALLRNAGKAALLLALAALIAAGCTKGFVPLTTGGSAVEVVRRLSRADSPVFGQIEVRGQKCRLVDASQMDGMGIDFVWRIRVSGFTQEEGMINDMRNQVADRGGNLLLIDQLAVDDQSYSATGVVYRCGS